MKMAKLRSTTPQRGVAV
ncbi:hypothetical protein HaLaN_28983, partial [Haematococcus lacustris]